MKSKVIGVTGVICACLFIFGLSACGSDESREDANDVLNGQVEKSAPIVIAFNNHFPNVETKCDGFGHRMWVITHDSAKGDNLRVLPDPTCVGPGTSFNEILKSNEQPRLVPNEVQTPPITATP